MPLVNFQQDHLAYRQSCTVSVNTALAWLAASARRAANNT